MRLAALFAVVLALAGAAVLSTLNFFNYFGDVKRSFAGQCTPVTGINGPADIELDRARSRAFISSLDRRAENARGAIHIFNLADPLDASAWRDMTDGAPATFRPLGLDYYEDGETRRLFVVNEANNAVELFDVGVDGALVHLETFAERRLTSPNDVVAVGPRSFYVTNNVRPSRPARLAALHLLARTGSGAVLYTDGTVWRVAAENLRMANGVDVSADRERLYVAETAGRAVRVFERDDKTGVLTPAETVRLAAAPDNIAVDDAGGLWVAASPKPFATLRHAANPARRAPSEVVRLGSDGAIQSVYRDDGTELSAATAAARLGRKLLIGALYENKFLICDLPAGAI